MPKTPKIPNIPAQDRSPEVVQLLEIMLYQMEMIQKLRDEIGYSQRK